MTIGDRIQTALRRYLTGPSKPAKPGRVYLGREDYNALFDWADEAMGATFPRNPETEDERLEFRGMKVYQHRASHIEFTA